MKNSLILSVILAALLLAAANSQVMGVDFGTEFWKAGLITPGKTFMILENSKSERKTANAISFYNANRLFEDEAVSKYARFPKATFVDINKIIPLLDEPEAELPKEYSPVRANGTIYFTLPDGKESSIQQLLAMLFKYMRSLGMIQLKSETLNDVVLAVPSHWGLNARAALVNAAQIAHLNVFSVINDNTAAAMNYAISRSATDSANVVLFNMGSANLQVSVVNFYTEHDQSKNKSVSAMRVLSHESIEVGGYDIDAKIATVLADKFNKKYNKNVQSNFRSWTRLLQKASEVKETLSANKDVRVSIENLMDGIDFLDTIYRSEIEDDPAFDKVIQPIEEALKKAGLTKESINSVQLIGGASRIPKVITKVTEYFNPVEVGTHINGDESVALGAVLHAANLSGSFRIKDIRYYENFGHQIRAEVVNSDNKTILDQVLFEKEANYYSFKGVEINETEHDISINLYRDGELFRTYSSVDIGSWKDKVMKGEQPTRHVVLRLLFIVTPVGLTDISVSYMPIYKNETYTREISTFQEVAPEPKQTNTTDDQSKTNSDEPQEPKNETKTKPKRKYIKKNVTYSEERLIEHKVPLTLTQHKYIIYNSSRVRQEEQLLLNYETAERNAKRKAEAKNELEAILYEIREKYDIIAPYSSESTISELKNLVDSELVWLEEDSYEADTPDFKSRLYKIKAVYSPILDRLAEDSTRQEKFNKAIQFLKNLQEKTNELEETHPWVAEKAQELSKKIQEIIDSYTELLAKQEAHPKHQEPLFKVEDITRQGEAQKQVYYRLKTTSRPKVKPAPKVETPKEEEKESSDKKGEEQNQQQNENKKSEKNENGNKEEQKTSKDESGSNSDTEL